MRRILVLATLATGAVSGCGGTPDACAGMNGKTCISVEVEASPNMTLTIDQLSIALADNRANPVLSPQTPGASFELPVVVGVLLSDSLAGAYTLIVDGDQANTTLASGTTSGTVALGHHAVARVVLSPTSTPPADLGSDDFAPDDGGIVCVVDDPGESCTDDTHLHRCRADGTGFEDVACQLGCSVATHPHCRLLYPTTPVLPSDSSLPGLAAISFTADTIINSDTGSIEGIRAANGDPTTSEVQNGIGYRISGNVGIFSFGGLTVGNLVTLHVTGSRAAAFVSSGDITLDGAIDAQGSCSAGVGGPGGGHGGSALGNLAAQGASPGGAGTVTGSAPAGFTGGGGGGAGYGMNGGAGGTMNPGAKGLSVGNAALSPIAGGSGGGAGGGAGGGSNAGGGGGGGIQLVANGTIKVGNGNGAEGVNAGGCAGTNGTSGGSTTAGGGGGGSGGAILVEAPSIQLGALSVLAANGGGGGGLEGVAVAQNGQFTNTRATGGGSSCGGEGGASSPSGGTLPSPPVGQDGQGVGCGGGGGAGRVRLNSQNVPSIDSRATVSPVDSTLFTEGAVDIH